MVTSSIIQFLKHYHKKIVRIFAKEVQQLVISKSTYPRWMKKLKIKALVPMALIQGCIFSILGMTRRTLGKKHG